MNAIEKTAGPCIILAGAGTGKTHTIVEKIKYLLKNNIYPPEKIVCLTFSNEATNSLRSRILPVLKDNREPIIRTFHAFCSDLLKKYGEKIGVQKFKVLLPEDAKIMLHKNLKVQVGNCHKYISTIGTAKDLGIQASDYQNYLDKKLQGLPENLERALEDLSFKSKTLYLKNKDAKEKRELNKKLESLESLLKIKKFLNTWKAYEKLKKIKGLLDYSDLNQKALELLEKHPEISQDYDYIIVDEFQDTNKVQLDLLKLISPSKNITVVGDLNQSIYRFRGAYKENFDTFKKEFNCQKRDIYTLDKSFRSPNTVLKVAHKLIQNNYKNKDECFFVTNAHNNSGSQIQAWQMKNAKEEARKIIEIIKSELQKGTPEQEICVLFRTHGQSRLLRKVLESEQIPYTAVSSKPLFKTEPIRKTLDYLRILDSNSKSSWWNLIHSSGFPDQDSIKIGKAIRKTEENIPETLESLELTEQGKTKLNLIIKRIKSISKEKEKNLPELILKLYEITGINTQETPNKELFLCLQKFHDLAKEVSHDSENLSNFLHHIKIMENLGIEIDAPSLQNSGIRIMTQHATKGLEYRIVIISNLNQKRFPIERPNLNPLIPSELSPELQKILKGVPEADQESTIKEYERQNQILEERRLCYVAFTRTKERLYLLSAKEYGGKKFYPSQFLNEVNYKENNEIKFQEDNQELYNPPLKIAPASQEPPRLKFSPSSLLLFEECQKRYEYKYIYNMPEPEPVSWEAIKLGSFVHHIIDIGIKNQYETEQDFLLQAKSLQAEEEWESVNLNEALSLLKVFFERNKNKYNRNSKTETPLSAEISGFRFQGHADRIDFSEKGIEIIDYKTGSSGIPAKTRNWQLGLYALAAQQKYGEVHKLTLDLLKKEKPLEFTLDKKGNAIESGGRMSFNLHEVKEEMLETAKKIQKAYQKGFKPCAIEKNCDFCNEYVWNL